MSNTPEAFMALAMEQAVLAESLGEVPVGAVVVKDGQVVGVGHNRCITDSDPSAHAEVVALRAAARQLGNYRLDACSLYVTLEPCPMCMGAVLHSRIGRLYFGAKDPKAGACGSLLNIAEHPQLNHHCKVIGGVSAQACADQLRGFFQRRRQSQRGLAQPLRQDALRLNIADLAPWVKGAAPRLWSALAAAQGLRVATWEHPQSCADAHRLVLCLHGRGTWSSIFQNFFALPLPPHTALWALDLPGHGLSDKTKRGAELEESFFTHVVVDLLQTAGFAAVDLVAHGGIAPVACHVAQQLPHSVKSLTLLNPHTWQAPMDVTDPGKEPSRPRSLRQLKEYLQLLAGPNASFAAALCAPYPDAGHSRGMLTNWQQSHGADSALSAMATLGTCPVRVVHRQLPDVRSGQDAWAGSMAATQVVQLDNGYFLGLDTPGAVPFQLESIHG